MTQQPPSSTPQPNRLINETSPYLLQHAWNPVQWYPWGEEALTLARELDKPILLSIGYSACHWCHVMAHESFENPQTAALMNRLFINIKVDREERPDLDRIYQNAHQLLTRRPGGWPLTMVLTPDQLPFFGGTYFPPTERFGLPAFTDVLQRIHQFYREHHNSIEEQNQSLLAALGSDASGNVGVLDDKPLHAALQELSGSFDEVNGGFGSAPKFPHVANLALLLRDSDSHSQHMALFSPAGLAAPPSSPMWPTLPYCCATATAIRSTWRCSACSAWPPAACWTSSAVASTVTRWTSAGRSPTSRRCSTTTVRCCGAMWRPGS